VRSDRSLKMWYREINARFFDNELPDNIVVKWGGPEEEDDEANWEEKYNGYAQRLVGDPLHYAVIVLNNDLRSNPTFKLSILVHEMIHVATDFRDSHGDAFNNWLKKLMDKGLFKKGALFRGITLF